MELIALATSLSPDRSLTFTLTVIIAGIGIVLFVLFLLILVFYAFGGILSKSQQMKAKKQKAKEETVEVPIFDEFETISDLPQIQDGISEEIVAAISAAIYAVEGGAAKITSIKKKNTIKARNPWGEVALRDNVAPF